MGPNMSYSTGGEGFCVYMVDPDVPGWDTVFTGTGPLHFVGKPGALLGVGLDAAGHFASGDDDPNTRFPNSVAVRAGTGELLTVGKVKDGVGTNEWRAVEITFDWSSAVLCCSVKIGGKSVLRSASIPGVHLAKKVPIHWGGQLTAASGVCWCVCFDLIKVHECYRRERFGPQRDSNQEAHVPSLP